MNALQFFRSGFDTVQIAARLNVSEAEASKSVWLLRCRERGLASISCPAPPRLFPNRPLKSKEFLESFVRSSAHQSGGLLMTYQPHSDGGYSSPRPSGYAGRGSALSPSTLSFPQLPMAAGTLCAAAPVTAQPRVANPTATLGILRQPGPRGAVRFKFGATEWRCYSPTGALVQKPAKPERRLFVRFVNVLLSLVHVTMSNRRSSQSAVKAGPNAVSQ